MSKAKETELTALHAAVAQVLTAQVIAESEETTFDESGIMVPTGNMVFTASPATIAAAIKFLKDNQITADIETDENLSNLKEKLAKKQRHSRMSGNTAADAAIKLAQAIDGE
tara:strand:+ start:860 stop:1195 length:336 start_codon:yes stop_codon:yes gene_type:complete